MRNIKMELSYDGTRYRGWQKQKNTQETIQGKLEALLAKLLEETIEVHGSGRTDEGVHARAQIANFWTDSKMDIKELKEKINHYLPEDIAVTQLCEAGERFHSRLNASTKIYRYRIQNSEQSNVFERKYMYQITEPLDVERMKKAAKLLCGTYDFKSFCANKKMKKSTIRTIMDISIQKKGEEIQIDFHGNGFLHHMVRILVGTLIEAGLSKREPEDMKKILEAKDRKTAGVTAPAQGLMLWEVMYS